MKRMRYKVLFILLFYIILFGKLNAAGEVIELETEKSTINLETEEINTEGNVTVKYGDFTINADKLKKIANKNILSGSGNVEFIQGSQITVNQISEALAIAPSTVTRFVDKLVLKGYVKREKSGKNSFTKITEEGLKIIPEIYKAWDGISEKIEEVVGNEEYLRKTGQDFKEFADILGKDKKYDNTSEDFDFWII